MTRKHPVTGGMGWASPEATFVRREARRHPGKPLWEGQKVKVVDGQFKGVRGRVEYYTGDSAVLVRHHVGLLRRPYLVDVHVNLIRSR